MNFLSWFKKGSLAVVDQGLFSGANFIVNILLARWLTPEEYGAFAVAMSVFYLLAGFHTAVLTEPMMVFGAGKYREHFRKYLGMLLYGHWAISVVISLILGAAAFMASRLGSAPMAHALAGLAIASPFLLLLILARRAPYVEMHPQWAVVGSGMNLVVTLCGIFWLQQRDLLSSLSGFIVLGTAAAGSSLVISVGLRPSLLGLLGVLHPISVFRDHSAYGSRNLVLIINLWQTMMLLLGAFAGLTATAVVGAIWNLYRPITLFMMALPQILLPLFVQSFRANQCANEWNRRVWWSASAVVISFGVYVLAVSLAAPSVIHFLFNGRYDDYVLLVPVVGVVITAAGANQVFSAALKAKGQVGAVAAIHIVSLVILFSLCLPLIWLAGVNGALPATAATYVIATFLTFRKLRSAEVEIHG